MPKTLASLWVPIMKNLFRNRLFKDIMAQQARLYALV